VPVRRAPPRSFDDVPHGYPGNCQHEDVGVWGRHAHDNLLGRTEVAASRRASQRWTTRLTGLKRERRDEARNWRSAPGLRGWVLPGTVERTRADRVVRTERHAKVVKNASLMVESPEVESKSGRWRPGTPPTTGGLLSQTSVLPFCQILRTLTPADRGDSRRQESSEEAGASHSTRACLDTAITPRPAGAEDEHPPSLPSYSGSGVG